MADNLPLSNADVTQYGSLKLPEPSGPHRPVMGLLYLDKDFLSAPQTQWDSYPSHYERTQTTHLPYTDYTFTAHRLHIYRTQTTHLPYT
jgi:hypothetical protein